MSLQNASDKLSCTPFSYKTYPGRGDLRCHDRIQIGLFFDGTNNNMERDEPLQKHSNVARLFKAYPDEQQKTGRYRYYIPGIGTPFPDIAETEESTLNQAVGRGGEARLIWVMLQILNSISDYLDRKDLRFIRDQIRALCTNGRYRTITTFGHGRVTQPNISGADLAALKSIGRDSGLVNDVSWTERSRFLTTHASKFIAAIQSSKPTPSELVIDIFGFSRGAALARVCANWLVNHLMVGHQVASLPAQIRFMGLFDTVASVGIPASVDGGGHYDWATLENLKIPREVVNCIHFVAAHEGRASFPVDSVRDGVHYPANCKEVVFPDVHSDVGGSYAPGAQGRGMRRTSQGHLREAAYAEKLAKYAQDSVSDPSLDKPHKEGIAPHEFNIAVYVPDDAFKLSQWSLNLMYQAACKGNVPLMQFDTEAGRAANLGEHFALSPYVKAAGEAYFARCGVALNVPVEQHLREHRLMYLAWRYAVRKNFMEQPGSQRAKGKDKEDLKIGNMILIDHMDEGTFQLKSSLSYPLPLLMTPMVMAAAADRLPFRHPQYSEIMAAIKRQRVTDDVAHFFDAYVNDSYASFAPLPHEKREPHGYVRYRTCFVGNHPRHNTN